MINKTTAVKIGFGAAVIGIVAPAALPSLEAAAETAQ